MPSTDRRLELKAKDIDGSDCLTAGCICQWVNCTVSSSVKFNYENKEGQVLSTVFSSNME